MFSRYFFVILILLPSLSHASMIQQIHDSSVIKSHQFGPIKLLHEDDRFFIEDEEGMHVLHYWQIDTIACKLARNNQALSSFQEVGYFEIKKDDYKEYLLRSHVRGSGGGLALGAIMFSSLSVILPTSFAAINAVVAYREGKDISDAIAKGAKDGAEIAAIVGVATLIAPSP